MAAACLQDYFVLCRKVCLKSTKTLLDLWFSYKKKKKDIPRALKSSIYTYCFLEKDYKGDVTSTVSGNTVLVRRKPGENF